MHLMKSYALQFHLSSKPETEENVRKVNYANFPAQFSSILCTVKVNLFSNTLWYIRKQYMHGSIAAQPQGTAFHNTVPCLVALQ